jgi:hypothetical protein
MRDQCPYEMNPRELVGSFYHVRTQPEGTIYEKVGLHKILNILVPCSWTLQPPEL